MGGGDGVAGLVGRGAELEEVRGLLAAARTCGSGVLVVRGEAGIGKSVLLDFAAARPTSPNPSAPPASRSAASTGLTSGWTAKIPTSFERYLRTL